MRVLFIYLAEKLSYSNVKNDSLTLAVSAAVTATVAASVTASVTAAVSATLGLGDFHV
jgi:hypothetical protein